jgi:hypothetical protein
MRDYIIATITRAFEVNRELAEGLYAELMQCVENKNLVNTVSSRLTAGTTDIFL